jgi:hypothetical protein
MLPQIIIRTTPGSLSIDTTPAEFSIGTRRLKLNLQQNQNTMRMHSTQAQVQIDQTAAFASAGLKKPIPQALEFYAESLQQGVETIGRIAGDSLRFLQIENPNDPVPEMARQRNTPNVSLNVVAMPSQRPQISVRPGEVNISFAQSNLQTDWEWVHNEGSYTPGQVNISFDPRPTIEISVQPGRELEFPIASGSGAAVDAAI